MKANQSFRNADEAVSPVIGVILMVAITVVLAAVVFVLVSDLGGDNSSAPAISFTKDDSRDRIEVTSAASGADWSRIQARVTSCTQATGDSAIIYVGDANAESAVSAPRALNAAAAAGTACGAASAVQIASSVTAIAAGDFLDFCYDSTADTTAPTLVVVQLTDTVANAKVYEATFSNVVLCA